MEGYRLLYTYPKGMQPHKGVFSMKNKWLAILMIALIGVIAVSLSLTGCDDSSSDTDGDDLTHEWDVISSIGELKEYLSDMPANTVATAYKVALNVSDLGGNSSTVGSLGSVLNANRNKYVSLNLSGSTFTRIGASSFSDCTSLASITIPNSVTIIGGSAFYRCTSLTNVTIPGSVTIIGDDAFSDCTSLASITIPNSVTIIGGSAFSGCTSLASVTIPNSVTSIGNSAFYDCTRLASVTIPSSVTRIGNDAFSSCTSLASVTIPNSVTIIGGSAFFGCTRLVRITIPNRVTSIGSHAFSGCTSLASVIIPSSVTIIEAAAFSGCTSLVSVTFETGSKIASANFASYAFPEGYYNGNNLKTAYLANGAGTYTRPAYGDTWTKQP
jgi:hypothetical protein